MSRLNLTGGTYPARSPVSSAQRQLNWYSEPVLNDEGEPVGVALYPTPGLTLMVSLPDTHLRGIRQCTNGNVYAVAGAGVYLISQFWVATKIGTVPADTRPVSMADNGIDMVIVDGSAIGWTVHLSNNAFAQITDPNFLGADRVAYLDTYFLFNQPGTTQFYWSDSLAVTFNALNIAGKTSSPDLLVTLVVANREIWLIGDRTTEIWYDSGDPLSAFARVDGVFIDHGCVAKNSVAEIDNSVFWLSQDRHGTGIVLQGSGYAAKRISSFALENALRAAQGVTLAFTQPLTVAIAWTYQLGGHSCYVLTFPPNAASATNRALWVSWVYDLSTEKWHEWCSLDADGNETAHFGTCSFQANFITAVGSWDASGNIYALSALNSSDNGRAIKRQRAFPHIEGSNGNRMYHRQFIANIEVGTVTDGSTPLLSLDWSDGRGQTFGNPITASLGAAGEYLTSVQYQRLGMARSRVYRLTLTSSVCNPALLGAFVDVTPGRS